MTDSPPHDTCTQLQPWKAESAALEEDTSDDTLAVWMPPGTCEDTVAISLDKAWMGRLVGMAVRQHGLTALSNWISTLGGAYAALGDDSRTHAEGAERMAIQQFHVARKLDDAALAARCLVFVALSLIQRGACTCCVSLWVQCGG